MLITIDVTEEQLDSMVAQKLQGCIITLTEYLGSGQSLFVYGDPKSDDLIIKAYIESFNMVIDYLDVPTATEV